MILKLINRCIIFCLLVNIYFISSDIFDVFNDPRDQDVTTLDHILEKTEAKIQPKIPNANNNNKDAATFKFEYQTVVAEYRSLLKNWIKRFPSKNRNSYHMFLELSVDEFKQIEEFAEKSNYEKEKVLPDVHAISNLLKRVVYKIEDDNPTSTSESWLDVLQSLDLTVTLPNAFWLTGTLIVMIKIIYNIIRYGPKVKPLILLVFTVSVQRNLFSLIRDEQAKINEILMKELPKHCFTHSKGMIYYMKSFVGSIFIAPGNECLEHQKALNALAHYRATPAQALSVTFAQIGTTGLGLTGENISHFFAGLILHVSTINSPIVIIVTIVLLVGFVFIQMGGRIDTPILHISRSTNREELDQALNKIKMLELNASSKKDNMELSKQIQPPANISQSSNTQTTNLQCDPHLDNQQKNESTNDNQLRFRNSSAEHASRSLGNQNTNRSRERSSSNQQRNNETISNTDAYSRLTPSNTANDIP